MTMKHGSKEWNESFYGKDGAEWLRRWDNGEMVWSVEMGGLGPSYEQCIQITAAEVLRYYLETKPDHDVFFDAKKYEALRSKRDSEMKTEAIDGLGLSGAQHGAACNLAGFLYRIGPLGIATDEKVKDRLIQVQKGFPR